MTAPVWQSRNTLAGGNGTSAVFTLPSSIAANDIILVAIYKENTNAITPSSGFTSAGTAATTNAPQSHEVFYKRMSGGETGTVTFSWTGNVYRAGAIHRISGCITSGSPIDGYNSNFNNTSAAPSPAVSLSSTSVDSLLFWGATNFSGGSSYATPTGFTERTDLTDVYADDTKTNSAGGSTGSITANANVSGKQTAILISLKPPATTVSGTGSVDVKKASLDGVGTSPIVGTGSVDLKKPSLLGSAGITGNGSVDLKKMNLSGAGGETLTGTGSVGLKKPAVAGTATAPLVGTGSVAMHKMGIAAAGPNPFIASIGGSGAASYFADGQGNPVMLKCDTVWGFPANAGNYSNTYQQDYDDYVAARSAQGYNAVLIAAISNPQNGGFDGGQTWDSVAAFSSPGVLNSTYWDRIDYLIDSAAASGMMVMIDLDYSADTSTGDAGTSQALSGWSGANFTSYGTAIGNRYKGKNNIVWWFGGDYFDGAQTNLNNLVAAIAAAGDTHLIGVENYPETTSRKDLQDNSTQSWGNANADFSVVYSYNTTYFGVEQAYAESSPILAVRGDGHYDNNGQAAFMRNAIWWALTSGSRGFNNGSEAIWQWPSGGLSAVSSEAFGSTKMPLALSIVEALEGWHQLVPDLSNALVTSGRGTRVTSIASGGGGTAYTSGNTYVTASITAGGSLALIYIPGGGTIGIDEGQMDGSYTATWIDPANGATSTATPGSSYTTPGTNSASGNDWVLALQSVTTITGTGSVDIKKASLSAAGGEKLTGTGSVDLKKPALSGAGLGEKIIGTGSVNLKKPSLSSAGSETVTGTGSVDLKKPSLSVAGGETLTGTGSVALKKPAVAGSSSVTGTGSVALKKPSLSGAGGETLTGTGSVSLKKPAVAGFSTLVGTGSVDLKKPSLSSAGVEIVTGTGSVDLKKPALSAAGLGEKIIGTGSVDLKKPEVLISGSLRIAGGSGVIQVKKMSLSGSGDVTTLSVTGTGSVEIKKLHFQGTNITNTEAGSLFIFSLV